MKNIYVALDEKNTPRFLYDAENDQVFPLTPVDNGEHAAAAVSVEKPADQTPPPLVAPARKKYTRKAATKKKKAAKKVKKEKVVASAKVKGACGACGKTGHSKWHCPDLGRGEKKEKKASAGNRQANGKAARRCKICNEEGHDVRKCPKRIEDRPGSPAPAAAPAAPKSGKLSYEDFVEEVDRRARAGEYPTAIAQELKTRLKLVSRVWPKDVPVPGAGSAKASEEDEAAE